MPKHSVVPKPNVNLVNEYIQKFTQSQSNVENALGKLFVFCPSNTNFEDVLLKVVVLNDLYRTSILATYTVAEHIFSLNIDALLQAGDAQAVHLIAPVQIRGKVRNNYSFASKYCSWHNSHSYPIFDSYVEEALWYYQKQDGFSQFKKQDLKNYAQFKQVVSDFQVYYGLKTFAIKDIDKYLWQIGKITTLTSNE